MQLKVSQSYVLVLDKPSDELRRLESQLVRLQCPVVITNSASQMMLRVSQSPPSLVILVGVDRRWSEVLLKQLRTVTNARHTTIVTLTDRHAPSWLHQEENPGFDGFLVKPLTGDVLVSLVQSALARQSVGSAT
ncbi:MAG: hypothetical protein D6742_12025 [Cyanobacteria bacterium J069]|nr:MAG: hypothetical protein D6742_12025 [Cyanobacteria bacterium J069]